MADLGTIFTPAIVAALLMCLAACGSSNDSAHSTTTDATSVSTKTLRPGEVKAALITVDDAPALGSNITADSEPESQYVPASQTKKTAQQMAENLGGRDCSLPGSTNVTAIGSTQLGRNYDTPEGLYFDLYEAVIQLGEPLPAKGFESFTACARKSVKGTEISPPAWGHPSAFFRWNEGDGYHDIYAIWMQSDTMMVVVSLRFANDGDSDASVSPETFQSVVEVAEGKLSTALSGAPETDVAATPTTTEAVASSDSFCEDAERVWIEEIDQWDSSGDQADLDQALADMAAMSVPEELEQPWADWQSDVGNDAATGAINEYLERTCGF